MAKQNTATRVKYNDIVFFLIAIPFINALNYYLTYTNIPFNAHTLLTFLIDTLEGYAAWLGLRAVIIQLDKRMPYEISPLKRILIQLVLTCAAALLIIIILTEIINWVLTDTSVPASFYRFDIFIFLIWFLVLNGIYIGLHYYNASQQVEQLRKEEKKIRTEGFLIKQGKQNISVAFLDILGFYVEGEYAVVITTEGKKYFLDQSLDKIEQCVPGEFFFRLNRQYIVNRRAITGFSRAENNKLNVMLNHCSYFPDTVLVSRTKAPAFKEWYKGE